MAITGRDLLERKKTKLTGADLLNKVYGTVPSAPKSEESTYVPTEEGIKGWQKYLDDKAKDDQKKTEARKEEKRWEKIGRWYGTTGAVDTSIPMGNVPQITHDLRDDNSYRRPKDDWSDEQKYRFGELYATSPSEAWVYAEKTNISNSQAKKDAEAKKIKESSTDSILGGVANTIGAVAASPLGLADYLADLTTKAAGRGIAPESGLSPFEYSQIVKSSIGESLNENFGTINESVPVIGGKGWGDVYGLGMSIAESTASGLTLGGAGTLINYFGQAAAAGVDDAIERGATDEQAILYGASLGAFEGIAEMIGIDNLFKIGSSTTVKGLIKNVIKQAGAEGAEEGLTSFLNAIADSVIMGDKSNFDALVAEYVAQGIPENKAILKAHWTTLEDIAFDIAGGMVSGGVRGGGGTTIKTAKSNRTAKKVYGSQAGALVDEAVASPFKSTQDIGKKYQDRIGSGKELSGWNINHLLELTDDSKLKSAVLKRLGELGETSDVTAVADVLIKSANGGKLSASDVKTLNESKAGHAVLTEMDADNIKSGNLANDWAANIGTRTINPKAYNKGYYDRLKALSAIEEAVKSASVGNTLTKKENATEAKFKASESNRTTVKGDDGKAEAVEVKKIASTKGGIKVELSNGKTVDASEVSFSSDAEAQIYDMLDKMETTPETANAIIQLIKPKTLKQATSYQFSVPLAYFYGQINNAKGLSNINLPKDQKQFIFDLGRADAQTKANDITPRSSSVNKAAEHKSGIIFEDGYRYNKASANKLQRASMVAIELIDKISHLEVHVFASQVVDGKRVAKVNGKTVKAPNGYFQDGNKIYIDINSGNRGEGAMLYTMAHEITHYIRKWNSKGFKEIADIVIEQFNKSGVSVDALLTRQKDKILKRYTEEGKTLPSGTTLMDMAYEELVADAMSEMLTDPDAYQKLINIKQTNPTIWEKIGEAIKALLKKLEKALGIYKESGAGIAEEAMHVRGFAQDIYDKLQDLYVKAFAEADANYEASNASDLAEIDTKTESVSPIMNSERTWTESEYVTARDKAAEKIANALGVTKSKALKYIDDVNSIARMIANDRARLDYEASSFGSAFVSNVEYGGSFDYTTLCKKRRIYTGTFTEIQKRLKDVALSPDDILTIRNLLIEEGIEATCGLCYVEGSRANMGKFAKEFIRLYKRDNPLAWIPNMADVNTPDGVEQMRISHPEAYEQYVYFWNHYGKLKDSDPALFASQQKPKLYEARKEYKGEIIEHFKEDSSVSKKNLNGGIRMQSFSDFEIVHLIDTMQVIMDMSTVGLAGQAYTKVPEFAKAFGNTGLKINLSLIAKGVDADGNLIFDDREGMSHKTAFELRDKYSKNVGTIIVTFTDEQLLAAMADPRIDFIIPFHRSQWKKGQYGAMGLPKGTKDYTYMQNEKLIKKTYHEYRGRMVLDKASNYMPNEYWDFSKSGKENAEAYLKMCAENNKRPKFYKLLDYDGKGTYSLKADGSTDGYWKLLIDFKMYDNDGIASPQEAVTPTFNMDEAKTMLDEYKGGHASYPVAHAVVDKFVEQYDGKGETKFSDRDSDYEDYSKPITAEDVEVLRSIGRKNINEFSSEEIKKAQKWAYKFYQELGTKSPFFRAWFGDWRAYDLNSTKVIDATRSEGKNPRGKFRNRDTGWEINSSSVGYDETVSHSGKNKKSIIAMQNIDKIIENAILLDTEVSEYGRGKKSVYTAFMHKFYALCRINGKLYIAKMAVDESYAPGQDNTNKKFYHVRAIEIETASSVGIGESHTPIIEDTVSDISIADLFNFVKQYDDKFIPNAVNPLLLNEDGTPKVFYHGTNAEFSVFDADRTSRTTKRYAEGFYFTEERRVAEKWSRYREKEKGGEANVMAVYLDVKNPLVMSDKDFKRLGFDDKHRDKVLQSLIENKNDGIIIHPETERIPGIFEDSYKYEIDASVYTNAEKYGITDKDYAWWLEHSVSNPDFTAMQVAVFNSEQVKSATDNIGTFNKEEENIHYSERDPNAVSNRTLLANALESVAQNDIEKKRLEEYVARTKIIDEEQKKLDAIREEANALRFKKGRSADETKRLKTLDIEAQKIENRITIHDKKLLSLESTAVLKKVLEQERAKLRRDLKQKGREALAAERAKTKDLVAQFQKSRREAIDSRHRTQIRNDIRKVLKRITKLFRGGKENNVKQGMKDAISSALAFGEVLLNDNVSNADIVMLGIDSVTPEESKLVNEYKDILMKRESISDRIKALIEGGAKEDNVEIRNLQLQDGRLSRRITELNKLLSDVFVRERARVNKLSITALTNEFAKAYKSLEGAQEEYIKNAYIPELYAKITNLEKDESLKGKTAKDMSKDDLLKLDKIFKQVEHTIRNANKYFRNGKYEDLEASASAIMSELDRFKDTNELSPEIVAQIKSFYWNELTPYYAFDKIGSASLMKYFDDLVRGLGTWAQDQKEAKAFAQETRKKHGYKNWNLDEEHSFTLMDGREFKTTLKHLMSIYAYSKRKQAEKHMRDGGFFHNDKATFKKVKGGIKFVRSDPAGYKIDDKVMAEIRVALGKDKMSYVDDMVAYLTAMGEKGNEASRILWGVDLFNEEVYFPLKSKDDFIAKNSAPTAEASLKNDGMTKEVVPNASNPIVLEAFDDVWANHIDRMGQYHGLVVPLDNFNKVLHFGTWVNTDSVAVSTKIANIFSSAAKDYLEQLIRDLNGGTIVQGATNPFSKLFSKFKKTVVGASLSTVVQQPTAILRAMSIIDPKYFSRSLKIKNMNSRWDELETYAPVAIVKSIGGFDAGGGKSSVRWINADTLSGVDKVMDKIDEVSMKGAEVADKIGWLILWEAVKNEVKDTSNLEVGSKEFLEACGQRITDVIIRTQVFDSTLSRSGFMRSKNEGVKFLTAFMGEPTLSINMIMGAVTNAIRGGKKEKIQAARTIAFVYLSTILAEALSSAIYALRDDDEDESYIEKYLQSLGGSAITDIVLLPVTSLPGVKDIISIFEGWNVERSDMAIFKDIKDAFDGLDSHSKSVYKKVEDFSGAIAALFGLPLKNVLRTGREVYNAFENIFDGISGGDAWGAFVEGVTGEKASKQDDIYSAIIRDDKKRIEMLKSQYKSEGAYKAAVRKALRENDPRIAEAAKARIEGRNQEYARIVREIVAEGHFDQDTVVIAINAEVISQKKK